MARKSPKREREALEALLALGARPESVRPLNDVREYAKYLTPADRKAFEAGKPRLLRAILDSINERSRDQQ